MNYLSMQDRNPMVPATSPNPWYPILFRNSIPLATLFDSTWTASLTFIFFFSNFTCCSVSLLAASMWFSFWTSCSFRMWSHFIACKWPYQHINTNATNVIFSAWKQTLCIALRLLVGWTNHQVLITSWTYIAIWICHGSLFVEITPDKFDHVAGIPETADPATIYWIRKCRVHRI